MKPMPKYPGYDVLAKRGTPSWDAPTRAVIDARLSTPDKARYLAPSHWQTLIALCATIVPQPGRGEYADNPPVPLAALVEGKLLEDRRDGFRDARLPPLRVAWETGLAALDEESERAYGASFSQLDGEQRRTLVSRMQRGELRSRAWHDMPCDLFFTKRVLHDVTAAYWSHPAAWSAMGFGGPANPRGYVRLYTNRRDAWEAVEAQDDSDAAQRAARRENERVR
ncbi:gluconate 2-dehydrogenase subunit 3 family protein [Paraburkholderia guartelaensis]|uniref:Gluconate 2-dehydrogenase subunit 3 family protein n=1 Tax=Paraburkholderia guartelaensis TaxID=2546446 RepID=A0A4R5L565_9BURK|nr:gluconate 2-dehydrogenase subunit 3 family protein [Paraburkholderia guartelaensis]TDG03396.1 gluconate 2-dehydrogenase subunit 3 family protein [Paraburkholderia guartelaensis]